MKLENKNPKYLFIKKMESFMVKLQNYFCLRIMGKSVLIVKAITKTNLSKAW
jgi:hypothetical protein